MSSIQPFNTNPSYKAVQFSGRNSTESSTPWGAGEPVNPDRAVNPRRFGIDIDTAARPDITPDHFVPLQQPAQLTPAEKKAMETPSALGGRPLNGTAQTIDPNSTWLQRVLNKLPSKRPR